ncbi:MAG: MOSC N-terminal beta barrel domain-containing protein [Burkholderiaceae bacterium]|nr:MOSC N-terminal beta barrel domain-containing protein [Burkholderiaceae bacterium]
MSDAVNDVTATIARLFVYPIKSCAGVEVREAVLTETGLEFDRAWMLVDEAGVFVTQRELPRMQLIRPQLKHFDMVLRAPGMLALHISLNEVEEPVRVKIWDDEVAAYDMGDVAAQWFSDFLGRKLRLVRFDPEFKRPSSRKWTGDAEAFNQFNDGYPVLVTSEASVAGLNERLAAAGRLPGGQPVGVERLRPNIVLAGVEAHDEDRLDLFTVDTGEGAATLRPVKPCVRCPIPDIDPATAQSSPEVGDMLRTYRANARMDGRITFGTNAIVIEGVDRVLRVGQAVRADYVFE